MKTRATARFGVPLALAGIVVVAGVFIPGFMSRANLTTILLHVSINGILALGSIFVIITAGIDLSVGSVVGLGGRARGEGAHQRHRAAAPSDPPARRSWRRWWGSAPGRWSGS